MSDRLLLEIVVKSTLVLLAAWIAAACVWRRSSAATRHLTWTVGVAAALLVPVLMAFGPAWTIIVPFPADPRARGAELIVSDVSGPPESPEHLSPRPDGGAGAQIFDPDVLFARRGGTRDADPPAARWSLASMWLLGVGVLLSRLIGGHVWVVWIARRASVVSDPDWLTDAADAAAQLGVHRPVRLLRTASVGVPAVCGLFRPAVLLPPESDHWTRPQRHIVLLHELAHVRRGDCVIQPLASLCAAVHWFNPLAHLAAARLRAEQERACDDHVLRAGVSAPDYAEQLCDIVQRSRRTAFPMWAALGLERKSRLEQRIQAMLDPTRRRHVPSSRVRFACVIGAIVSSVPLGAIRTATVSASHASGPVAPALHQPSTAPPLLTSTTYPAVVLMPAQLPLPRGPRSVARDALQPSEARAFLAEYCVYCHNAKMRTANVVLDVADLDTVAARAALWEQVVRRLRSGTHPPVSRPRAGRVVTDAFVAYVETALDRQDITNWAPDVAERLSSLELADRLSTFLWGAPPDEELQTLAVTGNLTNLATLRQQVDRLLESPRSSAFLTGFFGQWFYLENLDLKSPDAKSFPEFDESLRDAFRRETELFVASQVRDDRPVTELLTANYTFVNERLAEHYRIPNVSGPEFRRITVGDDARTGILGQGSVLTVTSYADRTSPVLRGKFVLETLFGAPPPPPPPNVPKLRENDPDHPTTMRTRLESAVKMPVCAACHAVMDPLGFALENFDAVGRWRETESGLPIDPSGRFAETPFNGPADFRMALLERSDAFVRTVAERLLSYAVDRPAEFFDMPAVRAIVHDAGVMNDRWSALIRGVVSSTPFQMKRVRTP